MMSLEMSGDGCTIDTSYVIFRKKNVTTAKYGDDGITLTRDAQINMPGVLAAGRVEKDDGSITGQWGCKTCHGVKYNRQAGKYKIDHYIGHLEYYVTATPVISNWRQVHAMILEKTATYVVIAMCDSVNGNFGDCDFEFMICGKN